MIDLDLRAGQIHRGLGVVARWPDIALVIPSDSAHDALVDQMFHDLGPEPEAQQIVAAVNGLLAGGQLRSVAMAVEATGGPVGMAFGPVEVVVDGQVMLAGADGQIHQQQLPPSAVRLTLRAANLSKAAEPVAPYDLRRGVAPGAGLTLVTIAAVGPANLAPSAPGPPGQMAPGLLDLPPPDPQAQLSGVPSLPQDPASGLEPGPGANGQPIVEASNGEAAGGGAEPGSSPISIDETPAGPEPVSAHGGAAGPDVGGGPPNGIRSGRFPDNEPGPDEAAAERAAPAIDPSPLQVPFRSVILTGAIAPDEAVPLPLAGNGQTGVDPSSLEAGRVNPGSLEAGRVEVQGVLCARQHFNNPAAAHCMVCGLSLLHLSDNLVNGLRPTLGFIVFDDGSTYGLDRSYVIGREPRPADGSSSQLLVLRDNNETLSRTHAALRLDDWTVELLDLGSTNGTYVWDGGAERWNQLSSGAPVALRSGDTVALGRRTFVFESVGQS